MNELSIPNSAGQIIDDAGIELLRAWFGIVKTDDTFLAGFTHRDTAVIGQDGEDRVELDFTVKLTIHDGRQLKAEASPSLTKKPGARTPGKHHSVEEQKGEVL